MKKSEANIEDLRNQTVSWGTHRPDDLIPKFLAVLKEYGKEAYDKYVSENPEVEDWKMLDDETKGWVVDELFDLLDGIAPEDCYFGALPGDGADFGFWQVDESKKKESLYGRPDSKKDELAGKYYVDIENDSEGTIYRSEQEFDDYASAEEWANSELEKNADDEDVFQASIYKMFVDTDTEQLDSDLEGTIHKSDVCESKKDEAAEGSDYFVIVFTSNEDAAKGAEYARNLGEDPQLPPGGKAVYVYGNDRDALKAFGKKWFDICVDDDLGTTSTFGLNAKDESKKSEASPNVATIEGLKSLLGRGIAVADNELRCKGVWKLNSKNPKQHQWTFVGDNGSISIKTDDDSKVIRIWGDLNKKSFDLGVSENKEESKKSEKGNKDIFTLDLTRIDAEGDEEGLDDMQAAQNFYDEDEAIQAAKDLADSYKDDDDVVQVTVMAGEQEKPNGDIVGEPFDIFTASSSDSATTAKYRKKANYTKTDGLDYYAKGGKSEAKKSIGRDQFIKDVLELADAEKQKYYRDELVSFARGCYDHGETSVDKVLSDYFADTNESKKSEGEDDKGCEGKDCKDDTTKKNEADATFKVGDFVTYDAASDGKEDFINQYVSAEIAKINDDGSLVLWIYDLDDGGNDVKDADPQFCTKLDHFAGKVDAGHYYMDGPYKAYKGGWEILITKKDLNPRVYEFIGTMDDLGEVLDVDAYYGGENFVYDQELEGAIEQQGWAADDMDYADMSGDLAKAVRDSDESKKSEATYDGDWQGATVYADSDARMNVDLPDNLLNDLEADGDVDQEDYAYAVDKFIDSCYNSKSYVSVGGKSYPLGVCHDPKLLIVQDNGYQFKGSDKAVELVKKLVGGKLTGHTSSEQPSGDFVAIKEDVGGREHYILYYEDNGASESKKSEDFRNYTLKQLRFQLKNGWAKDLTNASDEEIQAIIDSGHSIGGVSNGTYGMNGLLVNYTNPDGSLGSGVVIGRTPNLFALLSPQKPKKTGAVPKPSESKKSEGLPPKKLGNRLYRSRADLINKMKTLDAVEITTPAQFNDIHSKQWLHTAGYAMDINGNLVGQTYFGDKDGKWYYATTKTFQGDYLPECKEEAKKSEKATVICSICGNPTDDPIWGEGNRAFCKDCYSDGDDFKHGKTKFVVGMMISLDGVKQYIRELKPRTFVGQSVDTGKEFSLPISSLNRASILYDPRNESKKSESYPDWIAFYFCVDNLGDEYAVYPQGVHDRNGVKVVDLQSQYSPIGYHEAYKKDYILDVMKPIPLDEVENSAIYKKLDDGEDREIIAIDKKDAERIMNASNPLSELFKVVHEYDIYKGEGIVNVKKSESRPSYYDHPLIMAITYKGSTIYCGAEDGDMWSNDIEDAYVWDSFDTISTIAVENFVAVAKEALETRWISEDNVEYLPAPTDTVESKKSESLTLKQKELKNMARYGEATDITTISDAEAKELKKKGIETVGISRGAYGMNGALLRDNEGNKYVITARSSNLFYFV